MTEVEWHNAVLGEDSTGYTLDRTTELAEAAVALAGQARRRLDVLTPDLEPAVYDDDRFLEGVRALATASPRTELRFLVIDSRRTMTRGHRLIELARQLTSSIAMRQPCGEPPLDAFLLADDRGLCHRVKADRPEALLSFNDPLAVRHLRARFEALWAESEPDPELRRLHL